MTYEFHVDLDHLDQIVSRLSGLAGFLRDHLAELDHKVTDPHTGSYNATKGLFDLTAKLRIIHRSTTWTMTEEQTASMKDGSANVFLIHVTCGDG
ncbi:hypothetical protein [Nocardia australiensis]|uniref:hypothetical protein n=1 Tax=Nocardia australiensis TaxID=2887191 RepID=UPI001D13BCF8|nr:hypothetical protein [Nocardia australiensis]